MEQRNCECGCKQIVKEGNRFIHNHHMIGKKRPEHSKKLKEFYKNNPDRILDMSKLMSGKNNPMYGKGPMKGKKHSEESKKKNRISHLKYIKETHGNIYPSIGKHEKQILDEIQDFIEFPIIRQYPILGYFVDGYFKRGNVVFEVDEKPKIKEQDIQRENNIRNELNCTFIRIPTWSRES